MISVDNEQSAYSALFRLYVGVGKEYVNFNEKNFDKLIDNIIENHMTSSIDYSFTHPPIPVRVKAMKMFAGSSLIKNINENEKTNKEDGKLQQELDNLVVKIFRYPLSEFEGAYVDYLLYGGLLIIYADNEVHSNEVRTLYDMLSRFIDIDFIDPATFNGNNETNKERLKKAADYIINKFPERRQNMLMDIVFLAMNDREFNQSELNMILAIGIEYLRMNKDEVMDIIRQGMTRYYSPYRI